MEMVPKLKILTVLLSFSINIGSAGGDRALYALPPTYTTYLGLVSNTPLSFDLPNAQKPARVVPGAIVS